MNPSKIHPTTQSRFYQLHTLQGWSAQDIATTFGQTVYAVRHAIKMERERLAAPPLKSTPVPLVGERIAARKARARNDR